MKTKHIVTSVATALLSVSMVTATPASAATEKAEKCYGISKAKKNDCGTPKHACAGQATQNGDPSEWIYVLKGNCERIVGGSTTPPKD